MTTHTSHLLENAKPEIQDTPEMVWIERLTRFMDDGIRVPIIGFRFGMDAIVGMIPGIGDFITFGISGLMVLAMARKGVSLGVLLRMVFNILMDTAIGEIPVVGDIFDFFYKANRRNLNILKKHQGQLKNDGSNWFSVMIVFVLLAAIFAGMILSTMFMVGFVWEKIIGLF